MDNKKSLIALALVALVGIVGATYAYFTSSATLTNEFKTGTYATSVTEEFVSPDNWTPGTTTKKKVNVTNNGSVDVVARATYTEKWISKSGAELTGIRNNQRLAQFIIGNDWLEGTDGYYYYKYKLEEGETSSDFISSVTFNPNFVLEEGTDIECITTKENGKTTVNCSNLESGYAGATYTLEITIETIQADQKWIAYENAYYYNGVELPKLPSDVDRSIYPIAGIANANGDYILGLIYEAPTYKYYAGKAYDFITNTEIDFNGETLVCEDSIVKYYYVIEGEWVLVQEFNDSDPWVEPNQFPYIWFNTDILNEDGTIYMEGTEPTTQPKLMIYGE